MIVLLWFWQVVMLHYHEISRTYQYTIIIYLIHLIYPLLSSVGGSLIENHFQLVKSSCLRCSILKWINHLFQDHIVAVLFFVSAHPGNLTRLCSRSLRVNWIKIEQLLYIHCSSLIMLLVQISPEIDEKHWINEKLPAIINSLLGLIKSEQSILASFSNI